MEVKYLYFSTYYKCVCLDSKSLWIPTNDDRATSTPTGGGFIVNFSNTINHCFSFVYRTTKHYVSYFYKAKC